MGLIEAISKDNASLCQMAQLSSMLAPTRTRRRRPVAGFVRANATNVFASLQKALLYSCQSSHMASLYINHKSQQRQDPKSTDVKESNTFRIVLQHTPMTGSPLQWHCDESEIRLSSLDPRKSRLRLWLRVEYASQTRTSKCQHARRPALETHQPLHSAPPLYRRFKTSAAAS